MRYAYIAVRCTHAFFSHMHRGGISYTIWALHLIPWNVRFCELLEMSKTPNLNWRTTHTLSHSTRATAKSSIYIQALPRFWRNRLSASFGCDWPTRISPQWEPTVRWLWHISWQLLPYSDHQIFFFLSVIIMRHMLQLFIAMVNKLRTTLFWYGIFYSSAVRITEISNTTVDF